MAQYIDKTALVAEIERRINRLEAHYADTVEVYAGEISGLKRLLSFIDKLDTFEAKEVDLMKWLREVHKIDIDILSRLSLNADDDHCYSYIIKHQYDKYHYKTYTEYTDGEYLKFEEACEAAIKYCLENLI